MYSILTTLLCLSLTALVHSSTVVQSFSNESVGTMYDGDSTTLSTNPYWTAQQLAGATQLDISFTFTGDAHMFMQSFDTVGGPHTAQSQTQVTFTNGTLPLDVASDLLMSLDERPVISAFASGDTSSLYSNPMSYTAVWSTTDTSLISSLNGSSSDFLATVSHGLSERAELNELFGATAYSDVRVQDITFMTSYTLHSTSAPEPSSALLLGGGFMCLMLRRKR